MLSKMPNFLFGRPATGGNGPERYTVRIPLWLAENAQLAALEKLGLDETISFRLSGQTAVIEKRHDFVVLKIPNLTSRTAAEEIAGQIAIGLIRFSARKGVAMQFPFPPSDVARSEDPNLWLREGLQDSEYPSHWKRRSKGTITDGGIFPSETCILPEHERVWEYPMYFGRIIRPFTLDEVNGAVEESDSFVPGAARDPTILTAAQALWVACGQQDRRLTCLLLIAALDVLAQGESVTSWPDFTDILAEIRCLLKKHCDADAARSGLIQKLSQRISKDFGKPGMGDSIRHLVLRAMGADEPDSPEARKLTKEVNEVLAWRSKLAHGGGFRKMPTATENERLRSIVAAALHAKLNDLSGEAYRVDRPLQGRAGGDNTERHIEELEHLSGRGHSHGSPFNRDEIHER